MIITLLVSSSLMLAGIKGYRTSKSKRALDKQTQLIKTLPASHQAEALALSDDDDDKTKMEAQSQRDFSIAAGSLGFVTAGSLLFAPLTFIGVAGLFYLTVPTWRRAYYDLTKKRRFTRMVLEAIVLPGTILTGHYFAAAMAYFFLYFALRMVAKAKGRTNKNLQDVFVTPANRIVWAVHDGVEVECALKDVQIDDILVVEAGETVPVDGTVIEGSASIDQHMLTGESQLVEKELGDPVLAATVVLNGRIFIKVEKAGEETVSSQVSQVLNDMTSFTGTLELRSIDMADRWALPIAVLGGAATAMRGAKSGLAILWFPLDDALYTIGPLSVLNHLNMALKRGILVKDGRALEALRKVDTIVFDKTGTLTQDQPHVAQIHTSGALTENEVLSYAAAAEHKQSHPIALAILDEAHQKGVEVPTIHDAAYAVGYGLKVMVGKQEIRVGSNRFMAQESLALPNELLAVQSKCDELGYSLIYIAVDDIVVGSVELHSTIRPGTTETIAKLKDYGYNIYIMSGDNEKPTRHMAQKLGIDHYFAETLPEDKANLIAQLQKEGRTVCYVGDGINDAIALKQAEVSVSLSGASSVATDTAQIVLMNEQLDQLIDLVELANDLNKNFRNNLIASSLPSLVILGGVFALHLSLSTAIVFYMAGMAACVGNAFLPLLKESSQSKKQVIAYRHI